MMVNKEGLLISLSPYYVAGVYYRGIALTMYNFFQEGVRLYGQHLRLPPGLIEGSHIRNIANVLDRSADDEYRFRILDGECRFLIDLALHEMGGEDSGSLCYWRYK